MELRAFSLPKVKVLTGVSQRRLQYWDEKRLISPSISGSRGRGRRRLYDFRDLVSLRVASDLRRQGISLQVIRRVHAHLKALDYAHPLAELRFWVVERQLYFTEAETVRAGRKPEQIIASYAVPVPAIVEKLREDIAALDARAVGATEKRRGTLGGKPVVAGTRIPVASIRRLAAAGLDEAGIRAMYPDLEAADVAAALAAEPPARSSRRAS